MNKHTLLLSSLLAGLVACSSASAANLSKEQIDTERERVSASYKLDKEACASLAGNRKDICTEEAKGKEAVAKADLEFRRTGTDKDRMSLAKAKVEAIYSVAKERCDDQAGNAKDVCVKQAKADETKGLADVKLQKEVGAARTEAVQDKTDADYKVAAEKCDSLAGDAKDSCVQTAKSRFGKT